jgi:hypothetical protein
MTSGDAHKWDSKRLGYNKKVNEIIDLPYAWLGNKHRVLFHTPMEAMMIGYMLGGVQGAMGGLSHLTLDSIKDKQTKTLIEMVARMKTPKKTGKIVLIRK